MARQVMTDEEIIKNHHSRMRPRARVELKIVSKLIAVAKERGYILKVRDYEEVGDTDYDVKTALFNLDEATVEVYDAAGSRLGTIFLVFGNDGYDLLADYNITLEEFLKPVSDLCDRFERGLET